VTRAQLVSDILAEHTLSLGTDENADMGAIQADLLVVVLPTNGGRRPARARRVAGIAPGFRQFAFRRPIVRGRAQHPALRLFQRLVGDRQPVVGKATLCGRCLRPGGRRGFHEALERRVFQTR